MSAYTVPIVQAYLSAGGSYSTITRHLATYPESGNFGSILYLRPLVWVESAPFMLELGADLDQREKHPGTMLVRAKAQM